MWYICMGTMCLCVHIIIFNALNFSGKAGLFMLLFSSLDSDSKNYHILVPIFITANSVPWRYYDKKDRILCSTAYNTMQKAYLPISQ